MESSRRILTTISFLLGLSACGSLVKPIPEGQNGNALDGGLQSAAGSGGAASATTGTGSAQPGAGGSRAPGAGGTGSVMPGRSPQAGTGAAGTGVPSECLIPLSRSGCAPTYEEAIAPSDCSHGEAFWGAWKGNCAAARVVSMTIVDVAQTCLYDARGTLINGRSCSKTIGKCNCFYAGGVMETGPCVDEGPIDLCGEDAGTN